MTKTLLVAALALGFMACGNAETAHNHDHHEMDQAPAEQTESTAVVGTAKIDPVCQMQEGDIKWTEFSVLNTDTTWFCSPHCKENFDANPEKYQL